MYTNLIKLVEVLLLRRQDNMLEDIFACLDVEGSSNNLDEFIRILQLCKPYAHDGVGQSLRYRVRQQMIKYRGEYETDLLFQRAKI